MSRALIVLWLVFVIISVMVVVTNVKNVVLRVDVEMVIVFTRVKNVTTYIVTAVALNKNKFYQTERERLFYFSVAKLALFWCNITSFVRITTNERREKRMHTFILIHNDGCYRILSFSIGTIQ